MRRIISEAEVQQANSFFNGACRAFCIFAIGHISGSELPICTKGKKPDGRNVLLPASVQDYCEVATVIAKDQNNNNNLMGPVILSSDGAVAMGDGSIETNSETRCHPAGDMGNATHSIQVTGEDTFGATIFSNLKPL